MKVLWVSYVQLLVTSWTICFCHVFSVHGLSSQEYWSGFPFSSGDLPDLGMEPRYLSLQADILPSELPTSHDRNQSHGYCEVTVKS